MAIERGLEAIWSNLGVIHGHLDTNLEKHEGNFSLSGGILRHSAGIRKLLRASKDHLVVSVDSFEISWKLEEY